MADRHESVLASRLEAIPTRWSLVRQAHTDAPQSATAARQTLVLRYAKSIRRYVGGMVKNPQDAVTELRRVRTGADHRDGLHFLENLSQILCRIGFIVVHHLSSTDPGCLRRSGFNSSGLRGLWNGLR